MRVPIVSTRLKIFVASSIRSARGPRRTPGPAEMSGSHWRIPHRTAWRSPLASPHGASRIMASGVSGSRQSLRNKENAHSFSQAPNIVHCSCANWRSASAGSHLVKSRTRLIRFRKAVAPWKRACSWTMPCNGSASIQMHASVRVAGSGQLLSRREVCSPPASWIATTSAWNARISLISLLPWMPTPWKRSWIRSICEAVYSSHTGIHRDNPSPARHPRRLDGSRAPWSPGASVPCQLPYGQGSTVVRTHIMWTTH